MRTVLSSTHARARYIESRPDQSRCPALYYACVVAQAAERFEVEQRSTGTRVHTSAVALTEACREPRSAGIARRGIFRRRSALGRRQPVPGLAWPRISRRWVSARSSCRPWMQRYQSSMSNAECAMSRSILGRMHTIRFDLLSSVDCDLNIAPGPDTRPGTLCPSSRNRSSVKPPSIGMQPSKTSPELSTLSRSTMGFTACAGRFNFPSTHSQGLATDLAEAKSKDPLERLSASNLNPSTTWLALPMSRRCRVTFRLIGNRPKGSSVSDLVGVRGGGIP